MTTPVIAVVGATATGKSALAVRLAESLGGEVINADASQLYRGMDIGTAKVTDAERRGIAHHQLDVLDVRAEASVATYQRKARADLDQVRRRGGVPIVVGGSGLYVRALLDELDIPPTDAAVRSLLERRLEREGVAALHHELHRHDPVAARAIDSRNGRRVVRALEVIELTGQPFSATMPTRTFRQPTLLVGLRSPRDVLDQAVATRVDLMWQRGLVEEVEQLMHQGLREGRTAARAVGYRQVIQLLDGEISAAQAREDTITATRRLIRRQESWFGADPRVRWYDARDPALAAAVQADADAGVSM